MSNDIIKAETGSMVAIQGGVDPFAAFADLVAPKYILGKLLSF